MTPSIPFAGPLFDWLRRARVRHWVHFLVLPLAGWTPGTGLRASAIAVTRGVATAFCLLTFGYLVNALADRHMDDPGKNPLATGGAGSTRTQFVSFAAAALALAALGPPVAIVASAVCLVSGWVYSVGPRLKAYPWVGTLLNATNFAPLLFVGTPRATLPSGMVAVTFAFVSLLLQNQLVHEAADTTEDARGDLATTARTIGPVRAAYAAAVLGAGVPAVLAFEGHWASAGVSALVFIVGFPIVLARWGPSPPAMQRARRGHRWASLVAGAIVFALVRFPHGNVSQLAGASAEAHRTAAGAPR